MDIFAAVLAIALLVEALIEVCKGFVPQDAQPPVWLWPAVGCVLGVVICTLAQVDALALLGVTLSAPVVGYILTGVLVSRGASFVHDLWRRINDGGAPVTNIAVKGFEAAEKDTDNR